MLWAYYENLNKWYVWEEDLESITIDGDFKTGTQGKMKLSRQPEMTFTLTSVIKNTEFWDRTDIPGLGSISFGHEIFCEEDHTFMKHTVKMENAKETKETMQFLKQVFSDVPDSMFLLKEKVEH